MFITQHSTIESSCTVAQVTNWIKSHVDSNPLVDLSPVFADYSRHLQALRSVAKPGVGTL